MRAEKWIGACATNRNTIDLLSHLLLFHSSLFTITSYVNHGPVKVSTGILRYDKRVEPGNLLKGLNLKLNANENVAMAA